VRFALGAWRLLYWVSGCADFAGVLVVLAGCSAPGRAEQGRWGAADVGEPSGSCISKRGPTGFVLAGREPHGRSVQSISRKGC
jgi:hypothetical protein